MVLGRHGDSVLPWDRDNAIQLVSTQQTIPKDMLRTCSLPVYLEHRQNIKLLRDLAPDALDWSVLCPATMVPESSTIGVLAESSHGRLQANAGTLPLWKDYWMRHIPLIGRTLVCAMNFSRYETTLEQNADFIARDLESYESRWSGATVGVIDVSR
jgi:hypothetical protein